MKKQFDCSGWATRANVKCTDGRTILENAFAENDGKTVPVVWNHQHDDPNAVLGHALLENRGTGVYAHISFNDTDAGQNAKLLVQHGDVDRLSIWANRLKQRGNDVVHGIIREVSLVLAGANPEAVIDSVMAHGEYSDEEAYIYTGEYIENVEPLFHSDKNEDKDMKGADDMAETTNKQTKDGTETIADVFNTLTEKQKKAVAVIIDQILTENGIEVDEKGEPDNKSAVRHSEEESSEDSKEETIGDILKTLSKKQMDAVYAAVGLILENAGVTDADEEDESNEGGKTKMKHNIFDNETNDVEVLSHSEMAEIFTEAKRNGSLADTVLAHGITNIDYLFPEAQTVDKVPGFVTREDTWVTEVMNAVHTSPFSRIKSVYADLTEDDARAKGYVKGAQKADEVFKLLKRVTTPTTVYKKQKIDRDDMIDITDFDVVAWLKKEMRMMLDEEIARAILIGDGRGSSSPDKINEQNIRPIWTDDDVYTVKVAVQITSSTTEDDKTKAFIKACIKSRKKYKGSGNPVMYMSEDMLTNCLLLEDVNGRVIYDTIEKLATALRVKKIVPVAVMEDLKRVVGSNTHFLGGIYVNLNDYNVGADAGGSVNLFDDFDIDYNAQKYLIETRCSGALTKPYSAVAIEFVGATSDVNPE